MLTEVWDLDKETFKTIQPDLYIGQDTDGYHIVRQINPFAIFAIDHDYEDNCQNIINIELDHHMYACLYKENTSYSFIQLSETIIWNG